MGQTSCPPLYKLTIARIAESNSGRDIMCFHDFMIFNKVELRKATSPQRFTQSNSFKKLVNSKRWGNVVWSSSMFFGGYHIPVSPIWLCAFSFITAKSTRNIGTGLSKCDFRTPSSKSTYNAPPYPYCLLIDARPKGRSIATCNDSHCWSLLQTRGNCCPQSAYRYN